MLSRISWSSSSASRSFMCYSLRRARLHPLSCGVSTTREYAYVIDCHGQLFLEETEPKNITSCYKDKRFLDFFFRRLKRNNHHPTFSRGYQYVSPCGREMNYVKSEDSPIVFHDLDLHGKQLLFAGSLVAPFLPDQVYISKSSGRVYHPIPSQYPGAPWQTQDASPQLGMIKSSLLISTIAHVIQFDEGKVVWDGQGFDVLWIN